jgi:hypothetical protein
MKKIIRLTESDLHRIVKESVNKILKEANWSNALTDPGNQPDDDDCSYRQTWLDKTKEWKEDHLDDDEED